jgi:hypothetical protein
MPDDKTTEMTKIEPLQVPIISTGTVSQGPAPMVTGTTAVTPSVHQPNITFVVIAPALAIFIRFANTYFTTLVGLVGAGLVEPTVIPAHDFMHLVWRCAGLAVAGAGFGLLKDLVTVFGRLEGKYPLATGSV